MFQLESRDDLGRILAFPLVKVRTTIGRDPNCDIVLEDEDVSRHHARIYVMGGQVKIKDENSANGTYVNNAPIADMADLPIGGEIIIGSNLFFLRQVDAAPDEENLQLTTMLTLDQLRDMTQSFSSLLDDAPSTANLADTVILNRRELIENIYLKQIAFMAHPTLEIIFGPDKGRKYVLTPGEHRLGRGANCNIRVDDPMVSGLHGTIMVDSDQTVYTDEGSRNGSILNNKIVQTHPLRHRDVLVLGSTRLKYLNPKEKAAVATGAPIGAYPAGGGPWLARYGLWLGIGAAGVGLVVLLAMLFFWR